MAEVFAVEFAKLGLDTPFVGGLVARRGHVGAADVADVGEHFRFDAAVGHDASGSDVARHIVLFGGLRIGSGDGGGV